MTGGRIDLGVGFGSSGEASQEDEFKILGLDPRARMKWYCVLPRATSSSKLKSAPRSCIDAAGWAEQRANGRGRNSNR